MKEKRKGGLTRLLAYAGGYRKLTYLGCLLSAVSAVLAIIPYICVWQVAHLLIQSYPDISRATGLEQWGWTAMICAAASVVVYYGALMCTHVSAFRAARNMRRIAVSHALTLPLGFFTLNESGRIRKIVDDNASLTEDVLAHSLPDLVGTVVTPIAAVVLMFWFDWRMGVLALIPLVFSIYALYRTMGGERAGFYYRYQEQLGKLSADAVEYVRGIPVVKVFQQTVHSFKAFYRTIRDTGDLASQYSLSCRPGYTAFETLVNSAFLLLVPAAMLMASSENGWDVLTDFVFYALLAPACGNMFMRIMFVGQSSMMAKEAVRKLDWLMDQKPLPEPVSPKHPAGSDVVFDHVSFTYPGSEAKALDDVSFTVGKGTVAALVGPSGGGKTTAASMIPRFWDADSGTVSIGGTDVRDIRTEELMDDVAFVFQDTRLFAGTIRENILAGRPDASEQEVLAAAEAAQCGDIIGRFPDGLDTVVGTGGAHLSGGEAQRIAIARMMLKDAPVVVLDEATAFADPDNEWRIQKAFEKLAEGKTVLIVAHRLSTVRNADAIYVMDGGRVVESGTHDSLVGSEGLYAEMWEDYRRSVAWHVGREASA